MSGVHFNRNSCWQTGCIWRFTTQSTPLRSCRARSVNLLICRFILDHTGQAVLTSRVLSAHTLQLSYLNRQRKGDSRHYFITSSHESYVAGPKFELAIPGLMSDHESGMQPTARPGVRARATGRTSVDVPETPFCNIINCPCSISFRLSYWDCLFDNNNKTIHFPILAIDQDEVTKSILGLVFWHEFSKGPFTWFVIWSTLLHNKIEPRYEIRYSRFATRYGSNRPAQLMKLARVLKFRI